MNDGHGITSAWLVRAGRHGEDEAIALSEGIAVLGFEAVPDLSGRGSREAIADAIREAFPDAPNGRVTNFAGQLAAFVLRMREGDVVAMPLKSRRGYVALGRIRGPYEYREIGGTPRHVRRVEWLRDDVPRSAFQQDLLYSLGAFMTVCRLQRNRAAERLAAMLSGAPDPGPPPDETAGPSAVEADSESEAETGDGAPIDVAQVAHDQIVARMRSRFRGHALARLVGAVLEAEGYYIDISPPGPDGGVDILAGRGPLGLDQPQICVQVKSSEKPADVTVLRALQGSMQTFGAAQGLLVSWGGVTRAADDEARGRFFTVRLWDAEALVAALYRVYDRLPEDIQAELPLKQVWALVLDDDEG